MLRQSLRHIRDVQNIITSIEEAISKITSKYQKDLELLQTVPGIDQTAAATIMAEIGVNMESFPSEQHISSWAGLSPGSYESAGKKKAHVSCRDREV